jgi:hypothetical protein
MYKPVWFSNFFRCGWIKSHIRCGIHSSPTFSSPCPKKGGRMCISSEHKLLQSCQSLKDFKNVLMYPHEFFFVTKNVQELVTMGFLA